MQHKRAIETRDRSVALFTIAHAVIARFRAEKDRRGLLDYEDLIDKTLDLLNNVSAAWVHYKLDRGIHHVLIDEAQDTSPKQWAIVKALVSEFFAGQGAHDRPRTIFAVGDEKQSIFSFQGAAPREFDGMRKHFRTQHERARARLRADRVQALVPLRRRSCWARSTRCSSRPHAHAGLTADPVPPVHEALPEAAPGLVEIWELATSDERNDDRALGRAVRHPERQQRDGEARQAHRRIGRGMAAPGPARQGRAHPGAAARRAVRERSSAR